MPCFACGLLHQRYGHLQEIIIQNFRAKPGTRMAAAAEPDLDDLAWTIALARLVFGPEMNIQAPPNLSPDEYPALIEAGINDWGGVSPVTPDHVNPEAPWPHVETLRRRTAAAGRILVERLATYPAYCRDAERWHDAQVLPHLLRHADMDGYARAEEWSAGGVGSIPRAAVPPRMRSSDLEAILARVRGDQPPDERDIVRLFAARADEVDAVCASADALRERMSGDTVRYVVNRNINYTNVCHYGCRFCAFSKGRHSSAITELRGSPYDLAHEEIARRVEEAWARGATEVCMQGGIHPDYTGETYLSIVRTVKQAVPQMHVHAFSPLEVSHGAVTLGLPVAEFLCRLREAGLGTLPGTAAEVLDDEVRRRICPDKINTAEWLDIMQAAHRAGLRTTATVLFGHVETSLHLARHLIRVRELQQRTGGFTEFVPLPFVHMEAPMFLKGKSRKGPDLARGPADARGGTHRVAPVDSQHSGLVGQARARRCGRGAAGGRERPGRHAHEREHFAGGRQPEWPGTRTGATRRVDRRRRPQSAAAHDTLRRATRVAARTLVPRTRAPTHRPDPAEAPSRAGRGDATLISS